MENYHATRFFPALLKAPDGTLLAKGIAQINPATLDVDFCSEFVPLISINSPLEIVRLSAEREPEEIHRFCGKTYLSSRSLLRIVGVKDEIIPNDKHFYCSDLPFSGTLTVLAEEPMQKTSFFHHRKKTAAPKTETSFSAAIAAMTDQQLMFLYDSAQPFYEKQKFTLTADIPLILPETTIQVERAFLFGQKASYICRFLDLEESARSILRHFLLEYSIASESSPTKPLR